MCNRIRAQLQSFANRIVLKLLSMNAKAATCAAPKPDDNRSTRAVSHHSWQMPSIGSPLHAIFVCERNSTRTLVPSSFPGLDLSGPRFEIQTQPTTDLRPSASKVTKTIATRFSYLQELKSSESYLRLHRTRTKKCSRIALR